MPIPVLAAQSVTELIALRAKTQPDDPAVHTGAAEFGQELKTLTYLDLSKAVDRLAAHYASLQIQPEVVTGDLPPERIAAVLTTSSINEMLLETALAKLGLAGLLLSTNNSTAAIVHLCKITKSEIFIYEDKYEATANEARDLLQKEGIDIRLVPETRFPLWGPKGVREADIPPYPARLTPQQEAGRTLAILHSSGSTGFPKPVAITHYALLANAVRLLPVSTFLALPLFHAFGHAAAFVCLYHGKALIIMPPNISLTSANICRVIRESPTPPVQQYAVPYVLKLLAETDEGVQTLAKLAAVCYAGAALPDNLGDKLVEGGVNLVSIYGSTECGAVLSSFRDFKTDKSWNWLRNEGQIAQYLEALPQDSNTFEVVVRDGWPGKVTSNRASDNAWCTSDLVLQHPEHPTWFKYLGRMDDTLNMLLGEKTNPVPIEMAIRGHSPLIQECIVFGDGKPQVGALILPSEQGAELSKDPKAFLDAVWHVIERANADAPTHSRILPEMVEILPYGTEIPVATKMSIIRPACYRKFADLIDSIYERFERGSGEPKKFITTKPELESFLTSIILSTISDKKTQAPGKEDVSAELGVDTDLFSFGIDSLQATRIKNVITKTLDLGNAKIGQNIVYEYPSVGQLAEYLFNARKGNGADESPEKVYAKMWDMVDHYARQLSKEEIVVDLAPIGEKKGLSVDPYATQLVAQEINGDAELVSPARDIELASPAREIGLANPTSNGKLETISSKGQVVVLTGATGSLGAHLLDQLTRRPDVSKVICLSRAKSHADSLRRLQDSLAQRHRTLTSAAEAKIVSYAADVNSEDLGLSPELYESLKNEATAVIHNAWPVNFVLSVESFDEHIRGAFNLIDLTLKAPGQVKPAFFFSSSVSAQLASDVAATEVFPAKAETAMMGYGRSKWVVEKIMERAGKETKARCGVLRIGQLAGDTENGIWNETESWPLMFKSVNELHALPMISEAPSWLPVDQAASTIIEIVSSTTLASKPSSASVYHIVNPHLSSWSDVLAGLAAGGLEFDTVPQTEWVARLSQSNPDVAVNPAYKLLDFYQARFGSGDNIPELEFKVERTREESETMRNQVKKVGPELVALWAKAWIESGFLA
ncbi:hypothetical protein B9479_001064 [Cryptococcus floricola]|uniref:Carrier domain-containing protein n=1 Tax=Cryptococcus floricola TaxID=2591691 RepID=A0A5D3B6F8_9TREE|nr:hypothetical protein B9479_001064 [Cryptococcus floricola]